MPPTPHRKMGHTAIVYDTFSIRDIHNMCPGNQCGPYCTSTAPECYITEVEEVTGVIVPRNPTDGSLGGRTDLPAPGGSTTGLDISHKDCPEECCVTPNENCFRLKDQAGFEIIPDEEIMLVFGGTTIRNKTDASGKLLYDICEEMKETDKTKFEKTCGEE